MNSRRLKVLKAFRSRAPQHRYNVWRGLGLSLSLGILLAIPLSGLIRVDLWRGNHRLLFQPASFRVAFAVIVGVFALIYAATFLINLVAGRMLCGWGCPVGQLHRLSEAPQTPKISPVRRGLHAVALVVYAALLPLSILVWWSDWRVLLEATPVTRATLIATWAVLTVLALAHGKFWGWAFCRQACPIGLYYSFVAPAAWFGVTFPHADRCIECNLCDNVCPVDLHPRELATPIPYRGGISVADAPGRNHCLECGDCVRACEWIVGQQGIGDIPLALGFHPTNTGNGANRSSSDHNASGSERKGAA